MSLHWSFAFIGIPMLDKGRDHNGCDCWGLVWLIETVQFGRALPSYAADYISSDEAREVTALINRERDVQPQWKQVTTIEDGDILLFSRDNHIPHAAVAVGPSLMLHMGLTDSVIEPIAGKQWEKRLTGIYRWQP